MVESEIQREIRGVFHRYGWLTKKVDPGEGVEAGWPDLECFGPGARVVLIEVKQPGKQPSVIQTWQHDRLRSLGFDVRVMDDKDQALAFCIQEAAKEQHGRRRSVRP